VNFPVNHLIGNLLDLFSDGSAKPSHAGAAPWFEWFVFRRYQGIPSVDVGVNIAYYML
jgi:hypothetical protein